MSTIALPKLTDFQAHAIEAVIEVAIQNNPYADTPFSELTLGVRGIAAHRLTVIAVLVALEKKGYLTRIEYSLGNVMWRLSDELVEEQGLKTAFIDDALDG